MKAIYVIKLLSKCLLEKQLSAAKQFQIRCDRIEKNGRLEGSWRWPAGWPVWTAAGAGRPADQACLPDDCGLRGGRPVNGVS